MKLEGLQVHGYCNRISSFILFNYDTLSVVNSTAFLLIIQFQDLPLILALNFETIFEQIIQNPEHTFENETGIFEVSLIVTDNLGCTDTTLNIFGLKDEYWMYVPNSFTPDNDQINDRFCISFNGIRIETFSLMFIIEFLNLFIQPQPLLN